MHFFQYRENRLFAEDISVEKIIDEVGTPCYIYSRETLVRHYNAFDNAFRDSAHLICYSVKANSNLSILKTLINAGSGLDIVSGGELFRALKAGADPGKIVFSGVGKKEDEIRFAIKSGILMINIESSEELRFVNRVAVGLNRKVGVSIRINPDVDAKTHPYISTGLKKNKFGIESALSIGEYIYARDNLKNLELIGLDCHIGSQITEISPFIDALKKVKILISELYSAGISLKFLDLGGGLGIRYDKEDPPHPSVYGEAVMKETDGLGVTLIFEPGRSIAGNAGILVTRVLYTKDNTGKHFIVVDAAMNDLVRPSLYGSHHTIQPVIKKDRVLVEADIVGPICESGDCFAQGRETADFKAGDFLAIMSAGAYGFSMSSNYNSRPRSVEVLVDGDKYDVIREREQYDDLIRGEKIL